MENSTIYQVMFSLYQKRQRTDETYTKLWDKVHNGKATYEDAEAYSKNVAEKWSELLKEYCLNEVDKDEIVEGIEKAMQAAFRDSSYYASKVQENINDSIGLNLKSKRAAIGQSRIDSIIDKIFSGQDITSDLLINKTTEWLIDEPVVESVSRSAVTETIKANAKFHKEAGLYPYIERKTGFGGCCEWCQKMSGKYIYGEQPDDFFRIHKHCNCTINYMPSRGKWTKTSYSTNSKGVLSKNTKDL